MPNLEIIIFINLRKKETNQISILLINLYNTLPNTATNGLLFQTFRNRHFLPGKPQFAFHWPIQLIYCPR